MLVLVWGAVMLYVGAVHGCVMLSCCCVRCYCLYCMVLCIICGIFMLNVVVFIDNYRKMGVEIRPNFRFRIRWGRGVLRFYQAGPVCFWGVPITFRVFEGLV